MKLTYKQKEALHRAYNDGGIEEGDMLIHKNTINSLNNKGLIAPFNYSNCTIWELTDLGLKLLE